MSRSKFTFPSELITDLLFGFRDIKMISMSIEELDGEPCLVMEMEGPEVPDSENSCLIYPKEFFGEDRSILPEIKDHLDFPFTPDPSKKTDVDKL